jgi:prepilin-type N-terminal cleavage/methylation domain-containing protein
MESAPILANRAFTLVEMVVVVAIIGIITTIALASQSTFNHSLVLTDTAYSVAFSAREAQSFGSASRTYGSVHNPGYGIHLDATLPQSYVLFADVANSGNVVTGCPVGTTGTPDAKLGDCRYDKANDGTVQTFTFSRGFKIKQFC